MFSVFDFGTQDEYDDLSERPGPSLARTSADSSLPPAFKKSSVLVRTDTRKSSDSKKSSNAKKISADKVFAKRSIPLPGKFCYLFLLNRLY